MRIAYYFGWILLLAAFAAAAAEVLVRSGHTAPTFFVAAHDLWYAVWPSGLLILQIRLHAISSFLWDPLVLTLLGMPAWLLLGGPGFLCIGLFRPRRPDDKKRLEDALNQEKQLLLYDELAKQAILQGIAQDGDDMRPQHSGHEIFLNGHREEFGLEDKLNNLFLDIEGKKGQLEGVSEPGGDLMDIKKRPN